MYNVSHSHYKHYKPAKNVGCKQIENQNNAAIVPASLMLNLTKTNNSVLNNLQNKLLFKRLQ